MLPVVSIQNTNFVANGKLFPYIGFSAFDLFHRYLMPNGLNALVHPWLDMWDQIKQEAGLTRPLTARVFRYAAFPNTFAIDPWSYNFSKLTEFANVLDSRGYYLDCTCGDSQIVCPEQGGSHGQQQHLNETCAAFVPCTNVFVETCNQPFKNGIDTSVIKPPKWGAYLRDSGQYYENPWNTSTDLDFISYHGSRDDAGLQVIPKWVSELFVSASYLHQVGKPPVLKEPIGADEIMVGGRRSNDPAQFFRMGQVASFAGITFHSTDGIECNNFRPITRQCAVQFLRGVRGAIG